MNVIRRTSKRVAPPGLLVSVRSAAEARVALAGGAALIDVKEPANGPLGRADYRVIAEVVAAVAGRCPVSAALGELIDDCHGGPLARRADETRGLCPPGVSFVKWGLAGFGPSPAWRAALEERRGSDAQVVAVAYADWMCARAPSVEDVTAYAASRPGSVLLLDTHCKAAPRMGAPQPTLLDWMRPADVGDLCRRCRELGMRIALAGSLGTAEIRALACAGPSWFAVRGAACEGGRDGAVSAAKVRELVAVINQAPASV